MNVNNSLFKNIFFLLGDYALMAIGISLAVRSHLGLSPWDVLCEGFAKKANLSFGVANIIISFIIIIITRFIKIYPGLGTFLNSAILGFLIDLAMFFIPDAHNFIIQISFVLSGIVVMALGAVLYIIVDWGAGPRDNLLLGIILKLKIGATYVKPVIEGIVLLIGFALGGTAGLGTLLSLFLIGFFMDIFFKKLNFDPKQIKQQNIFEQIQAIRGGKRNENSNS